VAGGGGSSQTAPDFVRPGSSAIVTLELTVWGSGGQIDGRYTDIHGFYRVNKAPYVDVAGEKGPSTKTSERYEFAFPVPAEASGEIEYYFELKLDGHPSRIPGVSRIRIEGSSGSPPQT